MVLRHIGEATRHGFGGNLGDAHRQRAAVATQLLDGLGGVVQRGLHIGSGHQVLGCAQHLQHVGLGVVGGQVGFGQTAWFLHPIKAAVDTLRSQKEVGFFSCWLFFLTTPLLHSTWKKISDIENMLVSFFVVSLQIS